MMMLTDRIHSTTIALGILMLASLLNGCGGAGRVSRANNELREQVLTLRTELEAVRLQNAELRSGLESLRQEAARQGVASAQAPADDADAIPYVANLRLGRLSHARDTDRDGRADLIVLYLHPADGRNRFVQLAGSVHVLAAILPDDGEPQMIGRIELSGDALRDAYRSSFTGTHYSIEVPINLPDRYPASADVRASYHDLRTGRTFDAHRAIKLAVQFGTPKTGAASQTPAASGNTE